MTDPLLLLELASGDRIRGQFVDPIEHAGETWEEFEVEVDDVEPSQAHGEVTAVIVYATLPRAYNGERVAGFSVGISRRDDEWQTPTASVWYWDNDGVAETESYELEDLAVVIR